MSRLQFVTNWKVANLYVLNDKNEKINELIIKILFMSFFFTTFVPKFGTQKIDNRYGKEICSDYRAGVWYRR